MSSGMNVNILSDDDATIQLTWHAEDDQFGALLTVRGGKDHGLTVPMLKRLAWAALTAAMDLENGRPQT